MAAAAAGRWDRAEEHYRAATAWADSVHNRIEQAEVRRYHARMLLERDGPEDRDRARELLAEAIEWYREIGMPKHVEMAERMLGEAG